MKCSSLDVDFSILLWDSFAFIPSRTLAAGLQLQIDQMPYPTISVKLIFLTNYIIETSFPYILFCEGYRQSNVESVFFRLQARIFYTFYHIVCIHLQLMKQSLASIPPYQFYTALGQILSRVCHEHPSVINMLVDLIVRVFEAYPQHTVWFLISLHNVSSDFFNPLIFSFLFFFLYV